VGLQTRTPTTDFFTGLGLFSVGVLVGAGLGLLFAPKRGEDMRALVTEAWRRTAGRAPETHPMGTEAGMPPAMPAGH
jgi:gas vesicle protein